MSAMDSDRIKASLLKKGFTEVNRDHKYYEFYYNGKLTKAWTKISHGSRDIDDYLTSRMSKQLYLTKKQFKEFVECNLSQNGYEDILSSQSIISFPPIKDIAKK